MLDQLRRHSNIVMVKFIVCRCVLHPVVKVVKDPMRNFGPITSPFEMRTLYDGEIYSQEIDSMNGESVTVFKRNGVTVDTAGEFCGEYSDAREARVAIDRLRRITEVMES